LKLVASVAFEQLALDEPLQIAYPPFNICIVKTSAGVFAIEDACNHAGASLSKGPVGDGCIACPLHGYVFALATGELLRPKRLCDPQRTFVVREQNGQVEIYERAPMALVGL
jgi:nitrite reductase/ring-hydroxylating ferredoxin subunit